MTKSQLTKLVNARAKDLPSSAWAEGEIVTAFENLGNALFYAGAAEVGKRSKTADECVISAHALQRVASPRVAGRL